MEARKHTSTLKTEAHKHANHMGMQACKHAMHPSTQAWQARDLADLQKRVQNDTKILSIALHISGTIHHVTAIYGTH